MYGQTVEGEHASPSSQFPQHMASVDTIPMGCPGSWALLPCRGRLQGAAHTPPTSKGSENTFGPVWFEFCQRRLTADSTPGHHLWAGTESCLPSLYTPALPQHIYNINCSL